MIKHPLVNLWFFLGYSFSLLLSTTYFGLGIYFLIFLVIIWLNKKYFIQVLQGLKPIVYYLPIMIILYFIFSLFLTDNTLGIILNEAIFGCLKLFLMVGAMMFFFESIQNQDIVIIARSIWVRLNKPWKWVEDFFLFLGMTLRFYPTFQSNWKLLRNTRKSLGLEADLSYLGQVKIAAKEMPGLLIHQLRRADDIAMAMKLRGYGKQFPRGVTYPTIFNAVHLIQIILISSIYWVIHTIATI
jgi:energy-coupling factor transporter transmembrane protein EcfT